MFNVVTLKFTLFLLYYAFILLYYFLTKREVIQRKQSPQLKSTPLQVKIFTLFFIFYKLHIFKLVA
jgi:hypothetical protein